MPKRSSKKKTPEDENELAAFIVHKTTNAKVSRTKNAAAVALGRLGGKKGGPARAAKLSKKRRKEIAHKAAKARWNNK